jgi:hypothetical protein
MKKVLYFLCFSLAFLTISCKKKDACETKSCQPNAVCNNGKCECVNSYYVKGECVPKSTNTFYFAGKSCYCTPDTFALIINEISANSASYQMRFQPPLGGGLGGASTTGEYFTKPDGDSIRIVGLLEGTFTNCSVKGKKCMTELLGKFKGPNQIDATIRFFETSIHGITVDECKITLKK